MSKTSLTPIVLPGNPVNPLEAAPKQYVDTKGTHVVDPTEPGSPTDGLLWTDPDEPAYVAEGPQGPEGPEGPVGPAGPAGTTFLGYAQVTANQTGIGATVTDLTGLSVTVTVAANHRVRITGHGAIQQVTAAGAATGVIREGSTEHGWFARTSGAGGDRNMCEGSIVVFPTAGSHTYKLSLNTSGGTVTLEAAAGRPAFILVEDLGAI